ncbi:MATE family efflux transporter [Clostridium tagluense]|uniref:MATE family efflux transporter n=1 Tax=Clostridium tagluense TaxID=360422 RepID=UPI001C0CBC8A|nr:MATE family efflux transporter [Clostridium tagluense]MBU3129570.1 MATE family efflux transporter [Clostridium tagluense]MCB2310934.1 MATE family efflux transporter [Clostridium tagluense]MCB2315788.1 MATE family efflux transporter [Clostridium tagluense]MCB2320568.1 MATE family efflux transporter [Clostridium tagluense]MCB2325527.1 MATE family efflux transporter [Clostridium tagluense]
MKWIRKDVFNLAIPILTEQLFVISLGMINTMMAGHIGKEAVSAIGMVDSINNIFIAFFSALAIGGMVVVAQFVGQGNIKKANATMKQALFSGLIITLLVTMLMFLFQGPIIASLFGTAEPEVISNAHTYLGITLLTYPLITIDLVANGLLRGAGDTKTPMKVSIFMNIINVCLTYTFINIFSMGIVGAALGIAIARVSGGIIILIVLLRGSKILKLTNIREFKFDKSLLKLIFGIGVPASVESLIFNGGKLITQIFIVNMGTIAIASNAIAGSVATMLNVPGNSLSIAATALVGKYMGRGETKEAENSLSYITVLSTVFLTVIALLFIPFAGNVVSLFTNNKEIIHLASNVLIVNSICIPLWSISFVLPSGLKGAGDVKYTLITTIIGMWLFRITLGYLLGVVLNFGLVGIWLGMVIDWVIRGSLYCIRFKKGKWKRNTVIKMTANS